MKIFANSETQPLQSVIVGYPDNFLQVEPEIINETQRSFYFGKNRPNRATIQNQIGNLIDVLDNYGVDVYQPRPLRGVPDQLMARDIGITIGSTLVITTMAAKSRQLEWRGIAYLFSEMEDANILFTPEEFVLEGGDVIVDKGHVFVGVGQRSTEEGVAYVQEMFPDFEVVAVPLKGLDEGEDVLHLDCSFVPVGDHYALIYPNGLREIPRQISETYELIEVTRAEQQTLGTNVLSINPEVLISRRRSARINNELRQRGLTVEEVAFTDPPKTGGSFRCCTLPLLRE